MKNLKRAIRRQKTQNVVDRRLPFLQRIFGENKELPQNKIGRCKKIHPFNCGNAKCICCNYEKVFDIPSVKQRKEKLNEKEMMDEV